MMPHLYLVAAILLEIAATFCLKLSNGFERPLPTFLAFMLYAAMNVPLILALKSLPLSLVYGVWAGMGVIAAATLGFVYFGETFTPRRLAFITITLVGVVGLNMELTRY